jgi:hypothetical protein
MVDKKNFTLDVPFFFQDGDQATHPVKSRKLQESDRPAEKVLKRDR